MAVNKIMINKATGTEVLMDLTSDTVTSETLTNGYTAHDKSGKVVTGTNPYAKAATDATVNTQADLIAQIATALEGKAAGGGGANVETCTVVITSKLIENLWVTCYADGQFYVVDKSRMPMPLLDEPGQGNAKTYTIENVVRYAVLGLYLSIGSASAITGNGYQQVDYTGSVRPTVVITAEDGATVNINIA